MSEKDTIHTASKAHCPLKSTISPYIMACFGTCLNKHDIVILGLLFTFFQRHLTREKIHCEQDKEQVDNNANRFSFKSTLLPTKTMITSFPRSARTSSIHFSVFANELRSGVGRACGKIQCLAACIIINGALTNKQYLLVISYTTTAQLESRI